MSKFIQSPAADGAYINKFGKRVTVGALGTTFTHFPGFNHRVHICEAETLAEAIVKFGLKPYVPPSKADLLKQLKAKREAVQYGAFAYMGKRIQCDDLSRANINTAATNAMIATDEQWPAAFAWRCADNSWLPLTRAQTLGMSAAFGQFLAACFATFATKAAQIEASEPCDINSGWPA